MEPKKSAQYANQLLQVIQKVTIEIDGVLTDMIEKKITQDGYPNGYKEARHELARIMYKK